MRSSPSTLRTLSLHLLDSTAALGGLAAGAGVGHWTHRRTSDDHSPASRLASGAAIGLATAVITDALLKAARAQRRHDRRGTTPCSADTAMPKHIARSASSHAASSAVFHWALGGRQDQNPLSKPELWHGHEDGTATFYLAPGQYLRFQPDHYSVGIKRAVDWEQQYTLETGQGSTVVNGPAHLLELLSSRADTSTAQERTGDITA
ncbi:hypothetical protein [Streptomyces sp. SGAir0957]